MPLIARAAGAVDAVLQVPRRRRRRQLGRVDVHTVRGVARPARVRWRRISSRVLPLPSDGPGAGVSAGGVVQRAADADALRPAVGFGRPVGGDRHVLGLHGAAAHIPLGDRAVLARHAAEQRRAKRARGLAQQRPLIKEAF
eukprot:363445-Chlamydomonas_euryale.AAC.5